MTSGAHEDASDHTCIVGSKTRGLSFPPPRNPNHLLLLVRNLVTPQSWVRIWKVLIGSADHSGYKSDLQKDRRQQCGQSGNSKAFLLGFITKLRLTRIKLASGKQAN